MEIFRKRPGTTAKGTIFEDINIANFVLQLLSNPKVKEFHLSSNDENYGAFDDIVVKVEYASKTEIYALQLKHKDKRTLALNHLRSKSGDFSIVKYFESFLNCKGAAQKFILLTNVKFQLEDDRPFILEGEDFYVKLSKFEPEDVLRILEETATTTETTTTAIIKTTITTKCYCYKFSIVEDASTTQNSARIQQYKIFFEIFFLYVNQKNVNNLKVSTENKFREMFHSNKVEFESYLNIISEWSRQEGKKEKLNKKWMQRAIAIHLLSSRTKPLSFGRVNKNRKILRQAISNFNITVFEENTNEKETELWGDAKKEIKDLNEIDKIRRKYQLSSTYIHNLDTVDPKLLSQLLWIMGKCPLIVTEDKTVYKAIKLCLKDKFIVLGNRLILKWEKHFSVFQDLSDLETQSNVYKDVMENFTCSLQGKETISLQVLMKQNQNVLKLVTTNEFLEMLDHPFKIGGEKEILPEPYVDRLLLRNVIDIRYVEKINERTLIILNCGDKLDVLKRKLEHNKFHDIDAYSSEDIMDFKKFGFGSTIYISKGECNLDKFEAICSKNKEAKNCHQFRYRDDGNLDWIRSKNDVSDLENYKMFYDFVEEKRLWSSQPDNNINVIIGDPGMGKTELMKSLKNKNSSGVWTVVVYPEDVYSFFKHLENGNNIVVAFEKFILNLKSKNFKTLEREIFKTSITQNTVVYVWDALDEILSDHLEAVTHIILQLSKRRVVQWVTSRQHLKKFLETKFKVLTITINQFNENEQKLYMKKRLTANSKEESAQIINKIESAFTLIEHKNVLGIPLQIFMLTELLRQNKNKYLDLLNNVFALTDLYHYFIEEKINLVYKEKVGLDSHNVGSQILLDALKVKAWENYTELALKAIFPEEILNRLKINCNKELQSIQTNKSDISIGIFVTEVTNGIPRFFHASFAEYLVALYFSKNLELQDILKDIVFQQTYVNVRFFFDLLLAKTSPSHIAVLYKDFRYLKECDEEILKRKDFGGRNVLHLACSWGQRYPPLKVDITSLIIDDVNNSGVTAEAAEYLDMIEYLADKCNVLENDTFFNMNPLSYAQKSDCLFAEWKIMQQQKTQLSSPDSVSINVLYYSARFGYSDTLDLFFAKNLPFIKTRKNGYSLLHLAVDHKDYMEKLLDNNIYKNKINDKDRNDNNTSLHLAVYNNYHETAAILIKHGAQIDALNYRSDTPLLVACQKGHEEIVEMLLKSDADINLANDNGYTPLSIASANGLEKTVKSLITSGSDINHITKSGATPLFIASQEGHERIVEILMKSGADINHVTNSGATPIFIASKNGHEKIFEFFIQSGADINHVTNSGATPLFIASQEAHERIVEILIKSGADINHVTNSGATPLFIASQEGHERIVEILMKSGAVINHVTNSGATPLFIASKNGHEKIFELFIKSGADINHVTNSGATPLFIASQEGHERIVEILIKSGANINHVTNSGATPLFIASQEGHERIVEILMKSGADINHVTNSGATPLFIASQEGHERIVEILIKFGANINHVTNSGATPLFIASQEGHERIVEILIKFGANINHVTNSGATPLFIASQEGHEKVVEILIKSRADINLRMNDGNTPLFVASDTGHDKIVELLIESEVDINLANNNGATPLFIASQKGYVKIVELLTLALADIYIARNDNTTPLEIASQEGHTDIVHILTTSGAKAKC